jgi:hypothetical protein
VAGLEVLDAGDDFVDHLVIVGDEEHRGELAALGRAAHHMFIWLCRPSESPRRAAD